MSPSSAIANRRAVWWWVLGLLGLVLVVAVSTVVVWTWGAGSYKIFSVSVNPPATGGSCGSVTTDGSSAHLAVVRSRSEVEAYTYVCINGSGPWPFVVDTGASSSAIAAPLAKRLGLVTSGAPSEYTGVGCTLRSMGVRVRSWSMGGVALAPQALQSQSLIGLGGRGEAQGLIGADVLSRFGVVELNYSNSTLSLGGDEGSEPTQLVEMTGEASNAPLPGDVTGPGPATQVGMTVLRGQGFAMALTRVGHRLIALGHRLGGGRWWARYYRFKRADRHGVHDGHCLTGAVGGVDTARHRLGPPFGVTCNAYR